MDRRQRSIQAMFGHLAKRYDLFNHLASLFLDGNWRGHAVSSAQLKPGMDVLDVCTGTGELAFRLIRGLGDQGKVIGIDFSSEMLEIAREKLVKLNPGVNVAFLLGEAEGLPFADDTFDCLASGFAMRNVIDKLEVVLKEMWRVLKPQGRVVIIEMSKPRSKLLRGVYYLYLRYVLPRLGLIILGEKGPFLYLKNSIIDFLEPEEVCQRLKEVGFRGVEYSPLTGGIVGVHTGIK